MAYSRYSYANWYIYYSNESGDELDDQVLFILGVGMPQGVQCTFTYGVLKDCVDRNSWDCIPGYTDGTTEDKEILIQSVKQFLEDAEEQFPNGD